MGAGIGRIQMDRLGKILDRLVVLAGSGVIQATPEGTQASALSAATAWAIGKRKTIPAR